MRHARFHALVLLACWQVLLASADDFNLARFVLLPAESESDDLLPLDDPNTDFTQSSETRAPGNRGRDCAGNPPAIPLPSAGISCSVSLTSYMPGPLARACSNTPLRC